MTFTYIAIGLLTFIVAILAILAFAFFRRLNWLAAQSASQRLIAAELIALGQRDEWEVCEIPRCDQTALEPDAETYLGVEPPGDTHGPVSSVRICQTLEAARAKPGDTVAFRFHCDNITSLLALAQTLECVILRRKPAKA